MSNPNLCGGIGVILLCHDICPGDGDELLIRGVIVIVQSGGLVYDDFFKEVAYISGIGEILGRIF